MTLLLNVTELICLHTVKWFQVLVSNNNSFICKQLDDWKCFFSILIMPNNTCRRTLHMAARSDLKSYIVCTAICTNTLNQENRVTQFIKAGTKPKKTIKTKPNTLSPSTDWGLKVDVIRRLIFPGHRVKSSLHL